jgi:hypothetical protein
MLSPNLSGICGGRELARLDGSAEGRMVLFGLVSVGLREQHAVQGLQSGEARSIRPRSIYALDSALPESWRAEHP